VESTFGLRSEAVRLPVTVAFSTAISRLVAAQWISVGEGHDVGWKGAGIHVELC